MLKSFPCAALSLAALTALLPMSKAAAQSTFHVKEFDFHRGQWVFETINANQGGFRPRSERAEWGHELGLAYAVTDFWLPKVLVSFGKDDAEGYHAHRLLFENVFKLKPLAENTDGFGLAWFQSVEAALNDRHTNATIFGPIFTAQSGKFSVSTNTFFEKTFGQNRQEGMNFSFAWQARYEVAKDIKIGVEGYGLMPEVGVSNRTPETGFSHRIGPVLIVGLDLPRAASAASNSSGSRSVKHAPAGAAAEPAHAELEFGMLFGTTEYTPDVTGKVNMHIHF